MACQRRLLSLGAEICWPGAATPAAALAYARATPRKDIAGLPTYLASDATAASPELRQTLEKK